MRSRMHVPRIHLFLRRATLAACCACLAAGIVHAQPASATQPAHVFFRVQAASSIGAPVSGRLLIFLKPGSGDKEVSTSEFHLADTWVAAQEIHDLAPGATVEFDADQLAFPQPFSALTAGTFEAQAVVD